MKLTFKEKESIQEKIQFLKIKLENEKKRNFLETYNILTELLQEEQKLNPKYTVRQLCLDNDLNEVTTYRMLAFRYASPKVKEMVTTNKVNPSKVCRMLVSKKGRENQDKIMVKVIKNKYSYEEVEKLSKDLDDVDIEKARENNNKWNIYRDIKVYSQKLIVTLPLVDKLEKSDLIELQPLLKHLRKTIDGIIEGLK